MKTFHCIECDMDFSELDEILKHRERTGHKWKRIDTPEDLGLDPSQLTIAHLNLEHTDW